MFQTIFIAPLYNSFIFLVNTTHGSAGWAIIILTLCIRALFYGAFSASIKTQMGMQEVQGELAEINEKYKNNSEEKARRTMELFKEKKIRPLSSFLALFIQLPVFFALYFALFREGLPHIATNLIYPFIHTPAMLNVIFIGLVNIITPHNIILALLVAATQYAAVRLTVLRTSSVANKMSEQQQQMQQMQQVTMLYTMPVILGGIAFSTPAGVSLYFITTNIVSVVQELLIRKQLKKK